MVMSDRWHITITPTPGSEDCEVNVDGEIYTVRGLALFADGGDKNLLSFFWNSPAVAAAGCVKSFAQSIRSENPFAVAFYKQLLQNLCRVTGTGIHEETPEEALKRFDAAQELYDSVTKDPKEWN